MNKKNKKYLIEQNLDAREEQLEEVERQKEAELERIGSFPNWRGSRYLGSTGKLGARKLLAAFVRLSKK